LFAEGLSNELVSIIDLSGRIVERVWSINNKLELNTSSYNSGFYFLVSASGKSRSRFAVAH